MTARGTIAATLTLWLVASPPALAQLNFRSTDVSIFGSAPKAVLASEFGVHLSAGDLDRLQVASRS